MNYKDIYDSLIQKRINDPIDKLILGEDHHIIPKSIDPKLTYKSSNIVRLTYREHFIAHKLLLRIYKNTKYEDKMAYAFWRMCYCNKDEQYRINKSSRQYFLEKKIAIGIITKNASNRIRLNNGIEMKYIKKDQIEKIEYYLQHGYKIGTLPELQRARQKKSVEARKRNGTYKTPKMIEGFKQAAIKIHKAAQERHEKQFWKIYNESSQTMKAFLMELHNKPLNPSCQKIWITDGTNSKRYDVGRSLPDGWLYGRSNLRNKPAWNKGLKMRHLTEEEKNIRSKNNFGRRHYTNGFQNIFVLPENVPEGFYPGITQLKKK